MHAVACTEDGSELMIKCTKGQVRWLKTALRWKIPAEQHQRIQMVLLRESGMTQPLIAAAMGVSLSTVNRAHMAWRLYLPKERAADLEHRRKAGVLDEIDFWVSGLIGWTRGCRQFRWRQTAHVRWQGGNCAKRRREDRHEKPENRAARARAIRCSREDRARRNNA